MSEGAKADRFVEDMGGAKAGDGRTTRALAAAGAQPGSDKKGKKTPFDWLAKASRIEVLKWLVQAIPTGSKQEAVSRLQALKAQVEEEVPAAVEATQLMADILERLDAVADPRPWQETPGDLLEVTTQTWEKISDWASLTDSHRFLGRFGEAIVRLERSDGGVLGTMPLDGKRVTNVLARVARWARPPHPLLKWLVEQLAAAFGDPSLVDLAYKPTTPPMVVALNLLADPDRPLPVLERVVEVPVLARDGTVHDRPGYDPVSRCFLSPARGLQMPPIPEHPTPQDIGRAKDLILGELLGDFPFTSQSELAHAVCLLLEQFVREMIDGPTPLYLAEAPTPGTGKSLLVDAATAPALGRRRAAKMAEARDPDEWRRRLTAKLRTAPTYLVIDNLRRPLDSGALAMTITAGEVEDRLLGVSEVVTLPVRCTLAATANNPTLSDEMARRTVRIRLDAGLEFPERRGGFRHPDLLAWAAANRGELIWATLILARAWVAEGRPPDITPLGGFEEWARVMGGILEVAEIGGFLSNAAELRAESQDTTQADFLRAVHEAKGTGEFGAREVVDLAREILSLGDVTDSVAAQRLGSRLRSMKDRPMGGLVLRQDGRIHGGARAWRVAEATRSGSASPSSPSSPPRTPEPGAEGDGGDDGDGHPEVADLFAEAIDEGSG